MKFRQQCGLRSDLWVPKLTAVQSTSCPAIGMSPPKGIKWSFWKSFGRRTLCSLLVASIITVLVVASYALSGGRSDLIQVLSASFSRDFAFTSNQSGTERLNEAPQAIKGCTINMTYTTSHLGNSYLDKEEIHLTSRRIPTIAELEQYEPHVSVS